MASPSDIAFCKQALALGHLSARQVDECLRIVDQRRSLGIEKTAREIAVELGLLDEVRAREIDEAGAPPEAPAAREVPRRLAGFEIIEEVGAGSMGTVYRARQSSLDKIVALKVLSPELARDRAFVERFIREARAAGHLNHPNIVHGIDAGEDQGRYYIAMEWIDGETLREVLERAGCLAERKALEIASAVARGLEAAARKHIVHRDIKPDNVMLSRDGRVKITDLGLAVRRDPEGFAEEPLRAMGTPFYIAPEAIRGERLDARSDIYSLGATLYHMVTGSPPFRGDSAREVLRKHLEEEPRDPRELRSDLSQGTAELILRLLRKDPAERLPSPKELATALGRLSAVGPIPGRTPGGQAGLPVDRALAAARSAARPGPRKAAPPRAKPLPPRAARRRGGPTGRTAPRLRPREPADREEPPRPPRARPQRTYTYLLSAIGAVLGILVLVLVIRRAERDERRIAEQEVQQAVEHRLETGEAVRRAYAEEDEKAQKELEKKLALPIENPRKIELLEILLSSYSLTKEARKIAEAIDHYRGGGEAAKPGTWLDAVFREADRLEGEGRLYRANDILGACLDADHEPRPTEDERQRIQEACERLADLITARWTDVRRRVDQALEKDDFNGAIRLLRDADLFLDPATKRKERDPLLAQIVKEHADQVAPDLRRELSPDEKRYRQYLDRFTELAKAYDFDQAYGQAVGGLAEVTDAAVRGRLSQDKEGFEQLRGLRAAVLSALEQLTGKSFALTLRDGAEAKEGIISAVQDGSFTFDREVGGRREVRTLKVEDLSPDDLIRLAGVSWREQPFRAHIAGGILYLYLRRYDRADACFAEAGKLGVSPEEWIGRLKWMREHAG